MGEPVWISRELTEAIHQRQLAEHGGSGGVRDEGMLESALARPVNQYAYLADEPDLSALAAAYAFGLSRNHAFVDGNKRTAYVVYRTFLLLNGLDITADKLERYRTMLHLAEGALSEADFAAWLRDNVKPA